MWGSKRRSDQDDVVADMIADYEQQLDKVERQHARDRFKDHAWYAGKKADLEGELAYWRGVQERESGGSRGRRRWWR